MLLVVVVAAVVDYCLLFVAVVFLALLTISVGHVLFFVL